MGRILSAAGDVAFDMKSVATSAEGFVITGRMGVWDAEIYLSYKEMLVGFLKPKVILGILKVPILLLTGLFRRKGK